MVQGSLRVAFAGTPAFAQPALEALIASGHQVVMVFTQPDRPVGRGQKLAHSPIKRLALEHDLSLCQPLRMGEAEAAVLRDLEVDVMVVAAFGQLLPEVVLQAPRFGCVNIHASILPRWRGAAPVVRAIQSGDTVTGVSIMQMERGLDTGPVLSICRVNILPNDTQGSLTQTLATCGAATLCRVLNNLQVLLGQARPQPTQGVTYAHKIEKKEALIDWGRGADDVCRHIKAFHPVPMAFSFLKDVGRVRILDASPVSLSEGMYTPGSVISVAQDGVCVACGTGAVWLKSIQLAGKPVWKIGSVPQQWAVFLAEGAAFSNQEATGRTEGD